MTKNKMRRDEDKDEVTATCMNQEKERKKEQKSVKKNDSFKPDQQ
jgi:hypothetical protein